MHSNTQSIEENIHESALPADRPEHIVLKAFDHTEYGELFVKTPEGYVHHFIGSQIGPTAYFYLNDWKALDDLVARGEVGFAEAYMHGLWDSPDLPAFLTFALANAHALERYFYGKPVYVLLTKIAGFLSINNIRNSKHNIMAHYDLGNEFYRLWLDKSMTYSCALFSDGSAVSLEDAQQAKYRRILARIGAKPGDHILEIGCGWGGFAEVAASAGINVTAITISKEQKEFAEERIRNAGLASLATIEYKDYREVESTFDNVVSIGMFEHVGEEYWPAYFDTVRKCLKPGRKALTQSITLDHGVFERSHGKKGFIEQYIFPGGMLPSREVFRKVLEERGLVCNEMFTFGHDYALTLTHWLERFNAQEAKVRALGYDKSFIRLWRMYLSSCIASFTTKRTDVMQAELMHAEPQGAHHSL